MLEFMKSLLGWSTLVGLSSYLVHMSNLATWNYKKMIVETVGYEENEFEVSKNFIFDQWKRSKCILISSVLSSNEKIDQALKNNKIKNVGALIHYHLGALRVTKNFRDYI